MQQISAVPGVNRLVLECIVRVYYDELTNSWVYLDDNMMQSQGIENIKDLGLLGEGLDI